MARQAAVDAALDRLDGFAVEYADHSPLVDQLRARYEHEADHAWPDDDADLDEADRERVDHQAIRLAVVETQRDAVIRLRDEGVIGDEALHRVERDLDPRGAALGRLRSRGRDAWYPPPEPHPPREAPSAA